MVALVYLLTFPNGKGYVGQTIDLPRRMRQHHYDAGTGKKSWPLYHAWRLHGKPEVRVLLLCESSESDRYERVLIEMCGTRSPGGYNLTVGGEGCPGRTVTEEQRQRMSKARKGIIPPPFTKERCRKISEAKKGKPRSESARAAIRRGKAKWREDNAEAMAKRKRAAMDRKNARRRKK